MTSETFKFKFQLKFTGSSPNEVFLVDNGGLDNLPETKFWLATKKAFEVACKTEDLETLLEGLVENHFEDPMVYVDVTELEEDGSGFEIQANIMWRRVERLSLTMRHVYPNKSEY